jgi:hypothetical protein
VRQRAVHAPNEHIRLVRGAGEVDEPANAAHLKTLALTRLSGQ